ncbi:MAG: hypothetical protein QM778_07190 [Myxococcales bacterium]
MTRAYLLWVLVPPQQLVTYTKAANLWLQGQAPYLDFPVPYAPGMLVLSTVPQLLANQVSYEHLFAGLMLLFDLAIVFVLWRLPTAVFGESVGSKNQAAARNRYRSLVTVVGYLGLTAVAGPFGLSSFELVPAFFTVAFLSAALSRKRNRWLPELLLALGIWVDLVPLVLLLPFAALRLARTRRPASGPHEGSIPEMSGPRVKRARGPARRLAQSAATLAVFLVALFWPFYQLAGSDLWQFLPGESNAGLGLESLYASVAMLAQKVFSLSEPVRTTYSAKGLELTGPLASSLASASVWVVGLGQLAAGAWFAVRVCRARPEARNVVFAQAALAQLLSLLVLHRASSSERLLWVAPLCALFFGQPNRLAPRLTTQAFAIFALGWVTLRFHAPELRGLELLPALLVGARYALLGLTFVQLLGPEPAAPTAAHSRAQRPWTRALPYLTATLFLAWTVAASLSDETDSDIFFHMKVAEDIFASFTFPTLDGYSATAAGRPFVAHEWLSGSIFLWTLNLFGPSGLSWLVALLASGCAALMFSTLPKRLRNNVLALPLLMLCTYMFLTRAYMRPHMFSLVLEALLVGSLERWRVTRSWRSLVWLVPMQVLWINLHGGALLAPTLVGVVFGAVALCVVFPRLQSSHPDDAAFTWDHVRQLFWLELAMLAATLVNPYGIGIFLFAIRLGSGPEYVTQMVTEWRPTLHLANRLDYWFWPYLAYMAVLACCLIARRREKPVVDVFLALTLAWISLRARRFLGEFAVLTFPIMARSIYRALDSKVRPRFWLPRHGFNIALAALMLATTLRHGFAVNMFARRHLGIGMQGDLAYDEIASLKAMDLSGAIMNDYEDGGLIIRELGPKLRPVMDPRIDIYGAELVEEWVAASLSVDAFVAYADKYGVNAVLRKRFMMRQDEVRAYLASSPDWQLLPSSHGRYLYVRKEPLGAAGHP